MFKQRLYSYTATTKVKLSLYHAASCCGKCVVIHSTHVHDKQTSVVAAVAKQGIRRQAEPHHFINMLKSTISNNNDNAKIKLSAVKSRKPA